MLVERLQVDWLCLRVTMSASGVGRVLKRNCRCLEMLAGRSGVAPRLCGRRRVSAPVDDDCCRASVCRSIAKAKRRTHPLCSAPLLPQFRPAACRCSQRGGQPSWRTRVRGVCEFPGIGAVRPPLQHAKWRLDVRGGASRRIQDNAGKRVGCAMAYPSGLERMARGSYNGCWSRRREHGCGSGVRRMDGRKSTGKRRRWGELMTVGTAVPAAMSSASARVPRLERPLCTEPW